MAQTYTAAYASTGTSMTTNVANIFDNSEALRSMFSGAAAPSSPAPVSGQTWLDVSGTEDVPKLFASHYGGADAWAEIGSVLHGPLDLGGTGDPQEIQNANLETLAAHVTPDAANEGRIYLHTGEDKAQVIVTSAKRETVWSAGTADYQKVDLPFALWERDATNPPTITAIGTTPTIRGWLFDAANEKASIAVRVPQGYSGDADLKLRLWCLLNATESAGDDIDWTLNWESRQPAAAEVFGGTSSSATVAQDCPTNVTQYTSYMVDLTIDFDDVTNPVAAGDLLYLEVNRTDLATVAGVIVLGSQLLVPSGTKATE